MSSRRNKISYDNMSPELGGCPAYIIEAGVFGVVFN